MSVSAVAVRASLAACALVSISTTSFAQTDAERLGELERMIAQQQARIAAQEQVLDRMSRELSAIAAELAPEPVAIPKDLVRSGGGNVTASFYGQVNRALLYYDDGAQSDVRHVDNDGSSTRIGFKGSAKASDDVKIGTVIEVQFESNSTGDVDQLDNTATIGSNSFTERKLELFVDSKTIGKLSLGQGDTASNGSSEVDLSGTDLVACSCVFDPAGGLGFVLSGARLPVDANANGNPDVRIKDVFDNLDGLSRDDRVRYDSPSFAGFKLHTSLVDGGEWDLAASYGGEFGGTEFEGKVGFANDSGTRTFPERRVSGSISALHESGFSLTLAAGDADDDESDREEVSFRYGKLGYQTEVFPIGSSRFSIDYGEYDDSDAAGDEGTTYGIGFVQKVSDWGTELYATYRGYQLDRSGTDFDDIDIVLTGARVKF